MSLFQKCPSFILLLATLLNLVSCQEKENIHPAAASGAGARLPSTDALTIPMVYTLTNRGAAVLSYDFNGRLSKVVDGLDFHQTFLYLDHAIVASRFRTDNEILLGKATFSAYLNDQGRVTKTVVQSTYPQVLRAHTELFDYYPNGQLSKHYAQNSPLMRAEYSYNAAGDLTLVTYYNAIGKVSKKVTLYYTGFGNDPLLNDSYHLNPEFDTFDVDLKIYGKFSNYLVRRMTIQVSDAINPNGLKVQSDYYYNYFLNANGYPTQRDCYNLNGANLVDSKKYQYSTSPLVSKF